MLYSRQRVTDALGLGPHDLYRCGNIRLVEVIPVRSLHVAHGPGLGLEIIMAPIGISRVGGINHAAPLEQVHIACKSIAPGFRRIKPLRALIEAHIAAGCKFPCIGVYRT